MGKEVLKATHGDTKQPLKIGGIEIPCYVLEDGTRVLSWSGVNRAFGSSIGGSRSGKTGVQNLPRILTSSSVKPFISKELMACAENAYEFQPPHGGRTAYGYDATLLPMMCEAILDAEKAGAFEKNPEPPRIANLLLRGFARVGIVALIDEATGYQELRARDALEKILEEFITNELRKWVKTFPDEFYKQMFRLRGWEYKPWSVKRPSVIGKYTNDLVYDRLAPSVRTELEKRNPKDSKGIRKNRHFQYLTDDVGHPKLREHLASVIALMRASNNWTDFMRSMNRALPKYGNTIELELQD